MRTYPNPVKSFITACSLALLLVAGIPAALRATESENINMQVLPAPGKVVIDGKFGDWDLTAGNCTICAKIPARRAISSLRPKRWTSAAIWNGGCSTG